MFPFSCPISVGLLSPVYILQEHQRNLIFRCEVYSVAKFRYHALSCQSKVIYHLMRWQPLLDSFKHDILESLPIQIIKIALCERKIEDAPAKFCAFAIQINFLQHLQNGFYRAIVGILFIFIQGTDLLSYCHSIY